MVYFVKRRICDGIRAGLQVATRGGASDIILKTDHLPRFRHNGVLVSLQKGHSLTSELITKWINHMIPERLRETFNSKGDADFSYEASFGARFRVNAFKQRGMTGMVLRIISSHVKTVEELQLPDVCTKASNLKRGLVLVTGATGSGKSTTIAAIIQKINSDKAAHIITIEDPIEYMFKDAKSTVNQREVGVDTESFSTALRASLRQNPDVIFVGELRDRETVETALMAAETGHLVFSTLHTIDSVESLHRIMSYFPPDQHQNIRFQLASCLQMVLSQRLVKRADGRAMVPAIEIMIANKFIKDLIINGERFEAMHEAISKGTDSYGMQSFDQALLVLLERGIMKRRRSFKECNFA